MSKTAETLPFQAEVRELLDLMIHSLYEHKEVFLRELVSNASDALDRLRFEALTRPDLGVTPEDLKIRIDPDPEHRTLSISDNGIGMNRSDLVEHLGTIARSGTRAFLERLRSQKDAAGQAPELIGQFGVGFYSCFMVADEVVVETRRAGETGGWRWTSKGAGEYTIEPGEKLGTGTTVTLHLRDAEEDGEDWLDPETIRDVIRRHSDFVAYPIELAGKTVNSRKPLWTRPRDSITVDEHRDFYRHLTHAFDEPFETIHLKAEGTTEYTALLYVPSERPADLHVGPQEKSQVALYVKRVLVMPDCEDLLPPWLRFVRGIVDAPDLPLNVSRGTLQQNPQVRQIKKHLTKRVLESLGQKLESDRAGYLRFWKAFGAFLKEGIWFGEDEDRRISKIALFETSRGEEPTSLPEYVARMKPDQKAIYWVAGPDRETLAGTPHLEALRKRDLEVLFFVDPIDEWIVQRLHEFEGKPLQPIDRGALDLELPAEKQVREDLDRENRDLLAAVEEKLREHVKQTRFTTRLADSPAVLVNDEDALSPQMERMLRAMNQEVPHAKRILELNPDHPLVKKLQAAAPKSEAFADLAELLYGQALLAEGSPPPDGARFAKLVSKLVVGAQP